MSVGSQTQKDQIKAGELSWRETEKFLQGLLILPSGVVHVFLFSVNAENILPTHRDLRQQRFIRHAVIAVGVVGRNVTLVTPEDPNLVPWNGGLCREERIKALRGRTTREGDGGSFAGARRL